MPRRLNAAVAAIAGLGLAAAGSPVGAQPAPDLAPAAPDLSPAAPEPAQPDAFVPRPKLPPVEPPAPAAVELDDEVEDQGIAAVLGLATGGRVTPGGLRIAGHYVYQLSTQDWFVGAASFTFGSGQAGCFRDRDDAVVCDHGLADGAGVEVSASVRRLFAAQGAFRPFARVGVGLGFVRFSDDDVSGITFPLHGAGGVRVAIAPALAIIAEADLALGLGHFGRGLELEPQLGLAVTGGVEFRLR